VPRLTLYEAKTIAAAHGYIIVLPPEWTPESSTEPDKYFIQRFGKFSSRLPAYETLDAAVNACIVGFDGADTFCYPLYNPKNHATYVGRIRTTRTTCNTLRIDYKNKESCG